MLETSHGKTRAIPCLGRASLQIAIAVSVVLVLIAGSALAEGRRIQGKTIISGALPKANVTIRDSMSFIGTQKFNLFGNSEAEQYIFVEKGANNTVSRFYLIQFEHDLPGNKFKHNYSSMKPTHLGKLQFNYDVKNFTDLAAVLAKDKGSDGAAMVRFLSQNHLSMSHKTTIVRMYHLPSADRRSELVIIYGEALPINTSFSPGEDIVQLDKVSPKSAEMVFTRARRGLAIQPQ
jgi:hypothetical protein